MNDSSRKFLHAIAVVRMPVILVGLIIAATILTGGFNGRFFSSANLVNVLRQVSFEAIIAFGMTLVIITGGIDLSVGSRERLDGGIFRKNHEI